MGNALWRPKGPCLVGKSPSLRAGAWNAAPSDTPPCWIGPPPFHHVDQSSLNVLIFLQVIPLARLNSISRLQVRTCVSLEARELFSNQNGRDAGRPNLVTLQFPGGVGPERPEMLAL
jgi:hypothetical protein